MTVQPMVSFIVSK